MENESEQFGQRRPPLSVTIKGILERYPDGQIFKEMIQNADDAGATTVWFYVDERQHKTSNLPHPALAEFQGPALVAANDACFTDEDWMGIQSLQQSTKSGDPFKVGRFGIGFNSVYHLTDLPIIVSGNRLACFEPQEVMWRRESGRSFKLPSLISQRSDIVAPFDGLGSFNSSTVARSGRYPHTLFRLPLRTKASDLSDIVYNTRKLEELLDALREEAKYLLLFLKFVSKIEVVHISQLGQLSLSFCAEIAPADISTFNAKRNSFMWQLKAAHKSKPYKISNTISFTDKFSVVVTDHNPRRNQTGTSTWLIANSVGSADHTVQSLELAQKEVGFFCFLPMPVEMFSGLPIHVNGTFGLNDERRTLKWPGIERRNDPIANWNKILVSQLLPPCYAKLLIEAKKHVSSEQFYKAWPDIRVVKTTQFTDILHPLLTSLFKEAVVWTERTEAPRQVGRWILLSQATFISEGTSLPSIVQRVLSNCGVQLVTIPTVIWTAFRFIGTQPTEVTPELVRSKLRSYPHSYSSVYPLGKRVLLQYCLSDNCHNDLSGLNLLPLANGTFTSFDDKPGFQQVLYLCSSDCPRSLLPNLDHILVDLSDVPNLQRSLDEVASSQLTKLRVLTVSAVASLLDQAMPSSWQKRNVVSMPHSQMSLDWLETFWNWLRGNKSSLMFFQNELIIPCYQSSSHSTTSFVLTRLNSQLPVVYVKELPPCSSTLLSALFKMNVSVCFQREFRFVKHRQLSTYMKQFDACSVLDAIGLQLYYTTAVFSSQEADSLRKFLVSSTDSLTISRKAVLRKISIFSSAANSSGQLYSISSAASHSVTRKTLGEPSKCVISVTNLPSNLILLSRGNYYQLQLLQALRIPFLSDVWLLIDHVLPMISSSSFPDHLIDSLMSEVLDMFSILNSKEYNCSLAGYLQTLPFLKTTYGCRKSPIDLFDPYDTNIQALYREEDVFPLPPFNTSQRIQVLRLCGLHTSVSPQQVLDIIYSISSSCNSYPQRVDSNKLSRAKAVLEYISTVSFQGQISGHYTEPSRRRRCTFSTALQYLATNRSWLPVLSEEPSDYPEELSWKGTGYSSHFVSLSSSVAVLSTSSPAQSLPSLVGSQMYLVSPAVSPDVASMLSTNTSNIARHVIAHFREILSHKDSLSVHLMDSLVHSVYKYMNSEGISCLRQLYSIQEWIYIKKDDTFVAPAVVALKQNSSFRHNLEPYVYILPDSLSQYSTLFGPASGVMPAVSRSQILSILKMIGEDKQSLFQKITAREAWSTVMSILNWLTDNGNKKAPDELNRYMYVPVESQSEWPQLMEASGVVYTDSEYLKDFLQFSDEKNLYTFVHDHISSRLAHNLGVVSLSEFLGISEDTVEDAGQYEPLTTRLKNILRDYKDGLTIIKELLQNADDAEATEVNICYDARQHETDTKKLPFPGMAEAHGPALIVHNDKTFTDEDFENITKLAGATKQSKALKIGKFGVGFCSVYHMTDAPSFISRNKLYIFDPTLSYLRKEIKNLAQPGKKIVFTTKYICDSSQLSPYDGLFGFDRSEYQGTMFRLPFRTSASELSETCYTEAAVEELVTAIKESSSSLLLFLQHVRTITFQRIDKGQTTPSVLLKVTLGHIPLPVSGTVVRELTCTITSSAGLSESDSCLWLVSQESEINHQQEYYTASVACPLGTSDNFAVDAAFEGETFCFLPLSQKTGLPVHVSSNFAVINNRRGIWTSDEAMSQADKEVEWNISLMEGVIPKAYHALLVVLKALFGSCLLPDYVFHTLWPKQDKLLQHNPWEYMTSRLYSLISSDELFYSDYVKQWLPLTESKCLQSCILCPSTDYSLTPSCVLKIVQYLQVPIVELPLEYHYHFQLEELTADEFIELFFENFQSLEDILSERNGTIQCMLEEYMTKFDSKTSPFNTLNEYFHSYSCIPCGQEGRMLRKCDEVVDPNANFADLFDLKEGRFPVDVLTKRELSMAALHQLGMLSETITWNMLIERAKTISTLYQQDKPKALRRTRLVLSANTKPTDGEDTSLSDIPFLPVLSKPPGYPLPWKGEGHKLMRGRDLMIPGISSHGHSFDNIIISGSQAIFVNTSSQDEGGCGHIQDETIKLLEIRLSPSFNEGILQLNALIELFSSQEDKADLIQQTDQMARKLYEFLDDQLSSNSGCEDLNLEHLKELRCIWTGQQFVSIRVAAKKWTINGPYLYSVPDSLSVQRHLTEVLDIKEEFTFNDIQEALAQMKQDFGDMPISEPCRDVVVQLVPLLDKCTDVEGNLMLPDENFVLHPSCDLSFNDAPWAPKDTKYAYVNDNITRPVAEKLGLISVRIKFLEKFASTHFYGIPFGQREVLTQRIQNILQGYPFDITVLKELLQNADDAKATKMYIIIDKRTHGKQRILSKEWEQLQGPALLLWNDTVFTDKDLQGIQELGLGSKHSDYESIGQYGVGFNVVYHLTDCPSFITGGETMCVLDPHCRYVPSAKTSDPGRRFDNLVSDGFWDVFTDMKSAYLQSGLDNCPPEIRKGGSLFRFPLRHTPELVAKSDILRKDAHTRPTPLTPDYMHTKLFEWAPKMKEAMFFLNHVTELRFFIIERNSHKLVTISKYQTQVDASAQEDRVKLHACLSAFKQEKGTKSLVIRYPLTIRSTTRMKDREHQVEEKWLIQQGVGDIENSQQTWKYIINIKPRHGIAAPIQLPSPSGGISTTKDWSGIAGKVFCFLPLPVKSGLPVHINGHFILDSNRRELWHSTDPDREDDKSAWNRRIFQAIASSYADFLKHAKDFFVTKEQYRSHHDAFGVLNKFYSIFPKAYSDTLDKTYLCLAENVYRTLVAHNSFVLAVVHSECSESKSKSIKVKWCPIKSDDPSTQVYFWKVTSHEDGMLEYEKKHIKPLVEGIGMQLTAAPSRLQHHFNKAITVNGEKLKETSPSTVYAYYKKFSEQVIIRQSDTFPCAIEDTIFKRAEVFKRFSEYLLKPSLKVPGSWEFPDNNPFSVSLLLTADNMLRKFDECQKVLVSEYSALFPKSKPLFLHSKLMNSKLKNCSEYFAQSEADHQRLVVDILAAELPAELQAQNVLKYQQYIKRDRLKGLWKCFSKDCAFLTQLDTILQQWALLPSLGGHLYSYKSQVLPVYPLTEQSSAADSELTDSSSATLYPVLLTLKIPFLDMDVLSLATPNCPSFENHRAVIKNLYFLSQTMAFSELLTKEMVQVIFEYAKRIDFRNNQESLKYIKSLPLFENVDGSLSSVEGRTVFVWNTSTSTVAYEKWIKGFDVIFLHQSGAWTVVGEEQLMISTTTAEEIYSNYIFRAFDTMNETERYAHLEHIKDILFGASKSNCQLDLVKGEEIQEIKQKCAQAITFVESLERLDCIGPGSELLRPVSDFCDHTVDIFTAFKRQYRFLPKLFTDPKVWNQWRSFFVQLKLKQTVSEAEFIQLCELTARRHENPERASSVLLKHLFSTDTEEAGWYQDHFFIKQVSNIAFVPAQQLPELSWIKKPYRPIDSGRVICNEEEITELISLSGVAIRKYDLVWTVKPTVKLPVTYYWEKRKLIESLGITIEPSVALVIENLKNICSMTKFTDFKLFDKYPESNKPPVCEGVNIKSLVEVMTSHFTFLQERLKKLTEKNKTDLKNIHCIPVPRTAAVSSWQVVLVKPSCVLSCKVDGYHPFLHSLVLSSRPSLD